MEQNVRRGVQLATNCGNKSWKRRWISFEGKLLPKSSGFETHGTFLHTFVKYWRQVWDILAPWNNKINAPLHWHMNMNNWQYKCQVCSRLFSSWSLGGRECAETISQSMGVTELATLLPGLKSRLTKLYNITLICIVLYFQWSWFTIRVVARYNGALPLPLGLIEHFESEEMEKLETENTTARKGRNTGEKSCLKKKMLKIVLGQQKCTRRKMLYSWRRNWDDLISTVFFFL